MKKKKIQLWSIIFATLSLGCILGGCASTVIDESNPEMLYKDAEDDIKSDRYLLAIDKLRIIRNKFPYSKYSVEAQLRLADVYFAQEAYPEAAAAYEAFRDLHPKHEKSAYSMLRAGKSYFKDTPETTARDLSSGKRALDIYTDFIRQYPSDPNMEEVRKDISTVRALLARKELEIGDFYSNRGFYESAKPRYNKVIEAFSDTDAAKQAQNRLAQIASKTEGTNAGGTH